MNNLIRNSISKREMLCLLVLVLGSLAPAWSAFVGWFVYDDEGTILLQSFNSLAGFAPYRDIPLEYGPLFAASVLAIVRFRTPLWSSKLRRRTYDPLSLQYNVGFTG